MRLSYTALFAGFLCLAQGVAQASVPTAATPPMGWNSWNYFAEKVTDADVRAAADAMVASGMRDAGYVYVNIDDGWQGQRDAKGVIHPNERFPDMKALADYVHARGLKIGIYSSPGPKTCAGYAGSLGHEKQDAQSYADWGMDYLKYDLCSFHDVMEERAPNDPARQMGMMRQAYATMREALNETHRPIVYSLCQYGFDAVWEWAADPKVGANLWRTTGDIAPHSDRVYAIASTQAGLAAYAGPGHWNDPDMLEVGNGDLTDAENRSHFSWWAMLAAPLLAGNDLAHMTPQVKAILTRREVIAIDQDPLGKQGTRAYTEGEVEVWTRPLSHGGLAVAVFNVGFTRYASTDPFRLDLKRLGLHGTQHGTNLWTGEKVSINDHQAIGLESGGVWMVRIDAPQGSS